MLLLLRPIIISSYHHRRLVRRRRRGSAGARALELPKISRFSNLLLVLGHGRFVALLVLGRFRFVLGLVRRLRPLRTERLGDVRDTERRILLQNRRALILGEEHVRRKRALRGVRVFHLLRLDGGLLGLGGLLGGDLSHGGCYGRESDASRGDAERIIAARRVFAGAFAFFGCSS